MAAEDNLIRRLIDTGALRFGKTQLKNGTYSDVFLEIEVIKTLLAV